MKRRNFLFAVATTIVGLLGLKPSVQRRDSNVQVARNLSNKTICHGEMVYLNDQCTAILGYTDLSHQIIGVVDPYALSYEITPGRLTFVQILDKSRSLSSQLISLIK